MNKRWLYLFFFPILIFSLEAAPLKKAVARPKVKVMATIFPLLEFAKAVAGERGEVSLLLPPGAEVHTWQMRVNDIAKFSSLDLFIYIGCNLEPWLKDILKSVSRPGLRILEAGQGLSLLNKEDLGSGENHKNERGDPHVWLDFAADQIIIDKIQKIMTELDSTSASYFARNAAHYKEKLSNLDRKYQETFQECLHRTFIFGGHAAFGRLVERYKLQQISLYGLSPDAEPTPRHLAEVIALAKKYRIKTIFFEAAVSPKLAKILAKEVGAETLLLNPGHNLTKKQWMSGVTFFDIMEENLTNLKYGLICR